MRHSYSSIPSFLPSSTQRNESTRLLSPPRVHPSADLYFQLAVEKRPAAAASFDVSSTDISSCLPLLQAQTRSCICSSSSPYPSPSTSNRQGSILFFSISGSTTSPSDPPSLLALDFLLADDSIGWRSYFVVFVVISGGLSTVARLGPLGQS